MTSPHLGPLNSRPGLPAPEAPAAADYHYILTIQWQTSQGGVASNTSSGVVGIPHGETRHGTFAYLLDRFRRDRGISECITLFFSLEPDTLGAS